MLLARADPCLTSAIVLLIWDNKHWTRTLTAACHWSCIYSGWCCAVDCLSLTVTVCHSATDVRLSCSVPTRESVFMAGVHWLISYGQLSLPPGEAWGARSPPPSLWLVLWWRWLELRHVWKSLISLLSDSIVHNGTIICKLLHVAGLWLVFKVWRVVPPNHCNHYWLWRKTKIQNADWCLPARKAIYVTGHHLKPWNLEVWLQDN